MLEDYNFRTKLTHAIREYSHIKLVANLVYDELCSSVETTNKERELQNKYEALSTDQRNYAIEIESLLLKITPYFQNNFINELYIADAIEKEYFAKEYKEFLNYLEQLTY